MNSVNQKIAERLKDAFSNPDQKACFYSANSKRVNSTKLNKLEYWDWTPYKSLDVKGNNTCIFPLGLGCKKITTATNEEWASPQFSEEELLSSKELELKNLDVWKNKTGEILKNVQEMLPLLKEDELIRCPDIQSPLGVAEIVGGSGLYLALLMNPEAIKLLLEKITDFIITFIQELKTIAGSKLNSITFPFVWGDQEGVYIADDTITLLSPQQHLEFSLPYVNKIAETLGPIYYHSCIWREEYFDNIKQVIKPALFNWNIGDSVDPKSIIQEFSGKAVLAPHLFPGMHETPAVKSYSNFSNELEMISYLLDCMQENTIFYLSISAFENNPIMIEEIYEIFDYHGFSPQAQGII